MRGRPPKPLNERLKNYVVDISTGCHLWQGGIFKYRGYARIAVNSKNKQAHRIVYEYYKGSVPEDLVVRHLCHNRVCVNPEHLAVGTRQDNMNDMKEAGRSLKGSKNPAATITEEDVRKIRELLAEGYNLKVIAKMFNRNWTVIREIRRNKTWKHVN